MAAMSAATSLLAQPLPEGAAVREAVIHPVEGGAPAEPPIAGLERAAGRAPLRRPEKRSSIRQRGTQARYRRDGDHNTRRFGDGLSIGSSRLCRSPDYEPDCEVVCHNFFSLPYQENARLGRKRHLDDALFEFFRKEAIKSLKNNFSNFCCHSDLSAQNKRIKGHVIGRDDFTCYSIKICKLNGRKPKSFEFCYYALAVYYLDSLDFGVRMLDQSVPRISVWKGNLIKFFSELDYKKKNIFGKRQLKKNLAHCYREFGDVGDCKSKNDASAEQFDSCFSGGFKLSLHKRFGKSLDVKIIDGVAESIQSAHFANVQSVQKCELMVNNVLNVLMVSKSFDNAPSEPTNVLGQNKCIFDHDVTESDIASKLDFISPNAFLKVSGSSKLGGKFVNNPATPDYVSSKAAELGTFNTAPAIEPMVKVRSRLPQLLPEEQGFPLLNTYPAGVKDTRSSLYMSSPISRINFSPNLSTKDPKAPCTFKVGNLSKHQFGRILNVNGSKGAPIPVADCSLKPQLIVQTPEVQITGASSFSFRQAELAKKGDELYNSVVLLGKKGSKSDNDKSEDNFIDLSQHAFEDRIVKDNLVILQPKNSLVLPLVQNGRFPVSDLDIKNYCAIVDLAYTQGIQKLYAVKYPKVHCSYISLGQSLMVSGHVDNFLIPVFCRKLFEDNHPSKSGRHHFFSLVGECILEYENDEHYSFVSKAFLGASSASKGKRLELSDRLFFPICRMRHWFTFCVDFKYRAFIFLDSLYNKDDDFHTSIKKRLKFWSPFMPMSLSKTILMTVVFSQ
uniref:Uncharacterized protein n=1 Tax=Avena sativa TaxID=4498 RepID=A0ACD5YRI8_AVESA